MFDDIMWYCDMPPVVFLRAHLRTPHQALSKGNSTKNYNTYLKNRKANNKANCVLRKLAFKNQSDIIIDNLNTNLLLENWLNWNFHI